LPEKGWILWRRVDFHAVFGLGGEGQTAFSGAALSQRAVTPSGSVGVIHQIGRTLLVRAVRLKPMHCGCPIPNIVCRPALEPNVSYRHFFDAPTVHTRSLLLVAAVALTVSKAPKSIAAQGIAAGTAARSPVRVERIPLTDPVPPNAESLPDVRLAKRPWLFEKLVGPERKPLVRMNPPRPPVALSDPPSAVQIRPRESAEPTDPAGASPADVADLDPEDSESPANSESLKNSETPDDVESPDDEPPAGEVVVEDLAEPPLAADESAQDSVAEVPAQTDSQRRDYTGHPIDELQPTRRPMRMQRMIARGLHYNSQRPEIADQRSNWGMMHSIMVYGIDTRIIVGRQRYSAIAWIAGNNACRGQRLLSQQDGRITADNGVGLQGHQGQFLAVLAMAGVPEDYALYAGQQQYSVSDLIETEKLACRSGEELTFTLIAFSHYLPTDSVWENEAGESWDFQRLIREELSQPIVGAACGGTHRLMGLAHALRARRAEGQPIDGQWERADQYLRDFVQYTYRLQNRDGSMSTQWFEGREDDDDLDRKIQTTGHMVEWLLTVTPDAQLQNPRLMAAIRFLLRSMYNERNRQWEIGPKGHALRSLAMFYPRVYGQDAPWRSSGVAERRSRQRRR